MTRKTDKPESPFTATKLYTNEAPKNSIVVNLGFPINMGSLRDQPNIARLTITDGTSRQVIAELDIPADQFMDLMRGGDVNVVASFYTRHPERIGKRSQNISTTINERLLPPGVSVDSAAETIEHEYLAEGWEQVTIQRTNTGRTVVARRWVDA